MSVAVRTKGRMRGRPLPLSMSTAWSALFSAEDTAEMTFYVPQNRFTACYNRPMSALQRSALRISALTLVAMLGIGHASAQKDAPATESAPDVPDAIAIPAGLQPVLFVRAKGSQIYTCQAGASKRYDWTLKGPEAELNDRKDKVIGQHSAGPTWRLKDGSEVTGKVAAQVDALDSESVPWLLLDVASNSKKGALANVTKIQRVHTHGGKPGNDVCDESHKDAETKSDYTADYYFFAPAN